MSALISLVLTFQLYHQLCITSGGGGSGSCRKAQIAAKVIREARGLYNARSHEYLRVRPQRGAR